MDSLEVLNGSGHLSVTWDPSNPEEIEKARQVVEDLKAVGYRFYAVTDDPISSGNGNLIVERIETPIRPPEPTSEAASDESSQPKKGKTGKKGPQDRKTVAVRQMAGG